MKKSDIVKLSLTGIAALLLLIVIIQNTETVTTSILFWTIPMPRVILLFIALAIGFALGMVTAVFYFLPRRRD